MNSQDGIKKIEEFLNGLTFGKTLLGANQADVYACLQDVSAMYEDVIAEMDKEQKSKIAELQQTINEKEERIRRLSQQHELPVSQTEERDEKTIAKLQAKLKAAQSYEQEYKRKTALLAHSLEEQQREKDERIARADRDARLILSKAKEEADELIMQAEVQARMKREESANALHEAAKIRSNMLESLRLIASDLNVMSGEVKELRGKVEELPDTAEESNNLPQPIDFLREKNEIGI